MIKFKYEAYFFKCLKFKMLKTFQVSPKVVNEKERPSIPGKAPSSLVASMGSC